jgi:hypothetical protein
MVSIRKFGRVRYRTANLSEPRGVESAGKAWVDVWSGVGCVGEGDASNVRIVRSRARRSSIAKSDDVGGTEGC